MQSHLKYSGKYGTNFVNVCNNNGQWMLNIGHVLIFIPHTFKLSPNWPGQHIKYHCMWTECLFNINSYEYELFGSLKSFMFTDYFKVNMFYVWYSTTLLFSTQLHFPFLTHCGPVTQICVFTLQLCKTDDANLGF